MDHAAGTRSGCVLSGCSGGLLVGIGGRTLIGTSLIGHLGNSGAGRPSGFVRDTAHGLTSRLDIILRVAFLRAPWF